MKYLNKKKNSIFLAIQIIFILFISIQFDFFDYTEPYIISLSPSDGAFGVSQNQEITISFSESINKTEKTTSKNAKLTRFTASSFLLCTST